MSLVTSYILEIPARIPFSRSLLFLQCTTFFKILFLHFFLVWHWTLSILSSDSCLRWQVVRLRPSLHYKQHQPWTNCFRLLMKLWWHCFSMTHNSWIFLKIENFSVGTLTDVEMILWYHTFFSYVLCYARFLWWRRPIFLLCLLWGSRVVNAGISIMFGFDVFLAVALHYSDMNWFECVKNEEEARRTLNKTQFQTNLMLGYLTRSTLKGERTGRVTSRL